MGTFWIGKLLVMFDFSWAMRFWWTTKENYTLIHYLFIGTVKGKDDPPIYYFTLGPFCLGLMYKSKK